MKFKAFVVALAVMMLTAAQTVSFTDPVRIFRADLLGSLQGTPLAGSMAGGAILVIKGYGFDGLNCRHTVTVGGVSCSVANLPCNWETVQCEMPPSTTERQGMTITVNVAGKGSATCTSPACLFSYSRSATPLLTDLEGRSVILGN